MGDSPKSPSDQDTQDTINSVVFPRKLLKKFILLYKELPCLWDRHSQFYKVKHRRHDAITKLTELVREHDPSATRVHVLRKIESLRACVRRERKRVRDSQRSATSLDDIYRPHLWYYELLSFVFGEDGVVYGNYTYPQQIKGQGKGTESEEDDIEPIEEDIDQSSDKYCGDYSLATSMVEVSDSSKMYDDDSSRAKRHCTEVDDEYDAIGVNVAAKLRNLPPNMRILAEKLINDVLFQAQVNGLTSATVISTPDPFK